jgi:hypothetical protein
MNLIVNHIIVPFVVLPLVALAPTIVFALLFGGSILLVIPAALALIGYPYLLVMHGKRFKGPLERKDELDAVAAQAAHRERFEKLRREVEGDHHG